ncbi:MAG TPA: phosphotransferase [Terracidiphilus sp.]|nr:phosphotransferase [Terracidiphilus sp.]
MTASETVKAHGLDGTLVAPDWPPLTQEEVRLVLDAYGEFHQPYDILSASPRPLSAASIIATRDRNVFLKRHARAVRDVAGIGEEHRFMTHLSNHGAPVPLVITTKSGETTLEINGWTCEVHELAAGVDLYEDAISWTPFRTAGHARSTGEMMARLHLAARGYDAPQRRGRPLVAGFTIYAVGDPAAEMEKYIAARPALRQYLAQRSCVEDSLDLLAPFHRELLSYLPKLQPMWTHNDFHPSNLFWSSRGSDAHATAVIDFGLCDRTDAVHDIAHAIERSIVEWLVLVNNPTQPEHVPVHLDHLWALLEGYESVRPLSWNEASALAPMLALCHAEFALSETDYFLDVLRSEEKAYMACEGYLVSHAQWWRARGAPILDSIRAWAAAKKTNESEESKL